MVSSDYNMLQNLHSGTVIVITPQIPKSRVISLEWRGEEREGRHQLFAADTIIVKSNVRVHTNCNLVLSQRNNRSSQLSKHVDEIGSNRLGRQRIVMWIGCHVSDLV